jgi:ATP-binding cassette subfamily B multidrug efflux pump
MHSSRLLARYLKPYTKVALLGPVFMIGEVTLDLMQPRLVQRIVDQGIARSDFSLVWHTGLWMTGIAIAGIFAGIGCTIFATLAAQGFGTDLRRALFGKIQTLSFGDLDRLETGSLITRLTNDVTQVQDVVMMLLRVMVRVPFLLLGSLIMAILTSPRLALLFIPLIPLVATVLVVIINKTYPLFGEVQRRLDNLNTVLQENLSGVRVVKAFAREKHEEERFDTGNVRLMTTNVQAARLGAATMPLMMIALNAGVVAALWLGGVQVKSGGMQAGQVIAFVNYLTQTLMSLMAVSMLIVRLSRAEASGTRIAEVLTVEPEIKDTTATAPATFTPRGRVAFENVSFAYRSESDKEPGTPVLTDISFVAEPGQTVAILGATGTGKSSLVQLIPRFYEVSAGRVTLDGVDVRDLPQETLRGLIGIALQETVLFSGTIRDNIRYGRPNATDDEVQTAARAAQAEEFIQNFPEGYDTVVGQRGVNLSGGQKQRIAIARALLVHPAVLILDDSTSAVDVATEARIQQALAQNYAGQTRIVVAQRISAVVNADLILVLEDGRLAGQGTHDELLKTNPVYREIYESQTESGVVPTDA